MMINKEVLRDMYILDNYHGNHGDLQKISDYLSIDRHKIQAILKELYIYQPLNTLNRGSVNHHYFKHWSANMAYILGFLVADGYIDKKYRFITFAIHQKDIEILEFIKKELGCDQDIKYFNTKTTPAIRLYIGSKIIAQDLKELGIENKKTFRLKIPKDMPDLFFPDFLRGYFDGDGCATLKRNKQLHCQMVSVSYDFLVEIRRKCDNIGYIYNSKTSKNNNVYYWHLNQHDSWKFRDLIYNGNFCLQRKHDVCYMAPSINMGSLAWRPEETEYLKNNVNIKTKKELAIELKRSYHAIRHQLKKLKLT